VDRDDVGVIERRCGFGYLDEPTLPFRVGNFIGRQGLDGDEPIEVHVAGLAVYAPPAFAELFDDSTMGNRIVDYCE
jgi:hypothetical protein